MEPGLSEDQQELLAMVRPMLARHAQSQAVRSAAESPLGYDPDLWRRLSVETGVAATGIPEELGGAGQGLFEGLLVLEELGMTLAPSPLLASLITSEALLAAGDSCSNERLLPRVAAGAVATIAWPGPAGGSSAPACVTAHHNHLSGTVDTVLYGDRAEVLLVVADGGTGPQLFQVDPSLVHRTWTPTMDTTIRLARLSFEHVPAQPVAGDAEAAVARATLVGTIGVTALAVGCAQRALDLTVAYTKERVQFGRPIGSFQSLKHRMADMLVLLEVSRSVSRAAGAAVSTGTGDAAHLAAVAASYTKDAVARITAEAIQLHGGVAITWEHDAQMLFKRSHALGQLFGTAHQHRSSVLS